MLFFDSFLGTLFLDTGAAGADTELDFFLGVVALAGLEPVPPGHYNGIL